MLNAKHLKTLKQMIPGLFGYATIILLFWLLGFNSSDATSVVAGIAFLEANMAKQKILDLESK